VVFEAENAGPVDMEWLKWRTVAVGFDDGARITKIDSAPHFGSIEGDAVLVHVRLRPRVKGTP